MKKPSTIIWLFSVFPGNTLKWLPFSENYEGSYVIFIINKINELANKKKTVGLTDEEVILQKELRKQYLALFKEGLKQQLEAIEVVDEPKH